jgi:hypothetical protein
VKLGKLPAREDPRTFKLGQFVNVAKLPPLPPALSWSHVVPEWGVALNDRLGCCVISGAIHAEELWSTANGRPLSVPDSAVLAAYEDIGGYRPGDPSTDNGCVMLDAAKAWRSRGITGNKLGAFAVLGHGAASLTTHLRATIALFGAAWLGFALPQCIEAQGMSWGVPSYGPRPGPRGDGSPGSLGGHCVLATGYHYDHAARRYVFEAVSWGQVYTFSELFAETYLDEGYALLDSFWVNGTRPAPSGYDAAALTRLLATVSH